MNLKKVLLCSFFRQEDRGSPQRACVAWPKSTQGASASAELRTRFLWVQVQASFCCAWITSSETYQVLLRHCLHRFWLSARYRCQRPRRASCLKACRLMTQEELIVQFKYKDREKPMSQLEGPLLFGWESGFLFYSGLQPIGWGPATLGRAICFT